MQILGKTGQRSGIFALCYGDSGSGKTHLVGTLGEIGTVLLIDVDKGHKTIDNAPDLQKVKHNILVSSFDNFTDLNTAYQYVKVNSPENWNKLFGTDIIKKPFDWIVWDTWSALQWNMLQELRRRESELNTPGITFRKNIGIQHWGMLTDLNKLAIESFKACENVNQLFIMQQTMDKDEISGQIFGGPAIHGKLVQEMPAYFDVVLRTYVNLQGKYCATTKPVGKWVAKSRLKVGQEYILPTAKQIFY